MKRQKGVTLLEILIAMLVLGLVTAGVMGAFVFSRQITWRSSTELMASQFTQELADGLRLAVGGTGPGGLVLDPGIYVDERMPALGPIPPGAIVLGDGNVGTPDNFLNLPANFRRFQISPGDGRTMVVESFDENGNGPADEDLDGDGLIGLDLDGDGLTDIRRVRIRVQWTSPTES